MNEFNTWGKVWTYVIVAFLSCSGIGIGWGLNVYTHWEPNVKQNFRIGMEANDLNTERIRKIHSYAKELKNTKDSVYLDSILFEAKTIIVLVRKGDKRDSTATNEPIALQPKIKSIDVKYVRDVSFRVYWTLDRRSKGRIKFGTVSGVYTDSTKIENSFIYDHAQTVGGSSNPSPLLPNTEYFYKIYSEDEMGFKGYSEEYSQKTNL